MLLIDFLLKDWNKDLIIELKEIITSCMNAFIWFISTINLSPNLEVDELPLSDLNELILINYFYFFECL